MHTDGYEEARKRIKALYADNMNNYQIGKLLGVSDVLIKKFMSGDIKKSPKILKAFRLRAENVDRMAARLTPGEGQRAREYVRRLGYKSITDYWLDVTRERK